MTSGQSSVEWRASVVSVENKSTVIKQRSLNVTGLVFSWTNLLGISFTRIHSSFCCVTLGFFFFLVSLICNEYIRLFLLNVSIMPYHLLGCHGDRTVVTVKLCRTSGSFTVYIYCALLHIYWFLYKLPMFIACVCTLPLIWLYREEYIYIDTHTPFNCISYML